MENRLRPPSGLTEEQLRQLERCAETMEEVVLTPNITPNTERDRAVIIGLARIIELRAHALRSEYEAD